MELYSEHESMLLNESQQTKRPSGADVDNTKIDETKSKKKRRSSLASTRRSITGNVPSKDDDSSDLPSSYSSSNSSQPPTENKKTSEPNLLNLRMEEIIQEFKDHISRLSQECAQWKLTLKNLEKEQEQTKLLSESNVSILPDEIPQEVKDLAKSEYIGHLIDFSSLSTRVENGLLKSYFDIQKCLQDVKMFRGTINTIKCHNKYVKGSLSFEIEEDFNDNEDNDNFDDDDMDTTDGKVGHQFPLPDMKSQLEWMMNN